VSANVGYLFRDQQTTVGRKSGNHRLGEGLGLCCSPGTDVTHERNNRRLAKPGIVHQAFRASAAAAVRVCPLSDGVRRLPQATGWLRWRLARSWTRDVSEDQPVPRHAVPESLHPRAERLPHRIRAGSGSALSRWDCDHCCRCLFCCPCRVLETGRSSYSPDRRSRKFEVGTAKAVWMKPINKIPSKSPPHLPRKIRVHLRLKTRAGLQRKMLSWLPLKTTRIFR